MSKELNSNDLDWSKISRFYFDVDGVMTEQGGGVTIYDVTGKLPDNLFRKVSCDGKTLFSSRLVACDENGVPDKKVEYLSGFASNSGEVPLIMEGYKFEPKDGQIILNLIKAGFPVTFISGRNSPCVLKRATDLGAVALLGIKDKLSVISKETGASLDEILFVGDGIQDCEVMNAVGISIAPADSCDEAIDAADFVTVAKGGEGVIYEVGEFFLKSRGLWEI